MVDKYAVYRTGKVKDLHKLGTCGQGYESERCINCKWVMGLLLGVLACGKGMIDAPKNQKVLVLGPK